MYSKPIGKEYMNRVARKHEYRLYKYRYRIRLSTGKTGTAPKGLSQFPLLATLPLLKN